MTRALRLENLRALAIATVLVAGAAAMAASCKYAPDPASGLLTCGPGASCPQGYHCVVGANNKCWKDGESPSGTGGSSGAGGTGGTNPLAKFVGHWVFAASGTSTVTCGTTTSTPESLDGDYVDLDFGTIHALTADYFCVWDLDVGPAGNATNIVAGQSCSGTDRTDGTSYTWQGRTFMLTTLNGVSATVVAEVPFTYLKMDGSSGTCTFRLSGPASKVTGL